MKEEEELTYEEAKKPLHGIGDNAKQDFSEAQEIILRNKYDTGSVTDPLPELPNFNGGYIEASKLDIRVGNTVYVLGDDKEYHKMRVEEILAGGSSDFKAYCADDGCRYGLANTFVKPTEQGEENMSKDNMGGVNIIDTTSVTDSEGKEYKFEKLEFEIVISDEFNNKAFGRFKHKAFGWIAFSLTTTGRLSHQHGSFDLTPIKSKWYEDESILSKGVPIVYSRDNTILGVCYSLKDNELLDSAGTALTGVNETGWRLATKQEIDSLFYDGKE